MAKLNGEISFDEDGNVIYPYVEKSKPGFKVKMSKGSDLPGVYTSYFQAEIAMKKALALREASKQTRRKANAS